MIKIDFDNFSQRVDKLRECLNDIPKPLYARISGGGEGIHVMSFHDDNGYREKYDDPERLKLDKMRIEHLLINNVLADVNDGKAAGEWVKIKYGTGIENFIILKIMKEHTFECDKCGDVRVMNSRDATATISHPGCGGTYRVSPSRLKSDELRPFESKFVEPKSVEPKIEIGQEYLHPKIRYVEKYRCPTCITNKECARTFKDKIYCFIDFKFNMQGTSEGVLRGFEIIELDDIKQSINVNDIVRLFINRDDKYSLQDPNNPDKFPDINETLTFSILVKSLKNGEITIGTRPVNPKNNTIKWIAWDIDREHNENPRAVTDAIVKYLREWYGLTGYIELSGSIDSYHVWVFLEPVDNNIAYNFDQDFRKRLKAIGIGNDPKSIERGVQLGEGGMIKLPYNYQRKEKYGHRGGRSRFVYGVDLSKIIPENLPAPWGNSKMPEINTPQPVTEEKTDPEINTPQPMAEEKIDQQKINNFFIDIIIKNEKVDGKLKCDNCPNENLIYQRNINEIIRAIKNYKHGCGGNVSFGLAIYETSIQILKSNTESVRNFCNRLMDNPNRKTDFDFEIRPTSDDNFENTLILKTKTEKDGKELAGWLVNSGALKDKLYKPAPRPFKVEKVYYFNIDFTRVSEEVS